MRSVQHAGELQTWTPARRGEPSFLAQSGTLVDLTDLRRGLVMDVNPVVTNRAIGGPDDAGDWHYERGDVEFGMNARWGITTDLTLNGTYNPDFSQIEADAAQVQFDPRNALSFPEKRPFFLEGNEQFAAPGGLIYTRRIADPIGAAKLGGRVAGMDIGFLSAVDDEALSATGEDNPVYNILRVRRNVGEQSTLGLTYTDRIEGDDYNRVAGLDSRLVLGQYTLFTQLAGSRTRTSDVIETAPLWDLQLTRAGREFGWQLSLNGRDPDFQPGSGFIARPGVAFLNFVPRITRFGAEGATLQSWSANLGLRNTWLYDRFGATRPDEAKLHFNNTFVLRGGWRLGASLLLENFLYPEALYRDMAIDLGTDTVPFVGRPSINNLDVVLSAATPQYQHFSGDLSLVVGRDENFAEWAPGYIVWATFNGAYRPNDRVRIEARYDETRIMRPDDMSTVTLTQIPRLKLEYQVSRPIFLRLVGQYVARTQDALHDDGRTERPLLVRDPATGMYSATSLERSNQLRFDWLFSYQPTPGTVLFAGYGSTLDEQDAARTFGFDGLTRRADGFFVKLSYLFRM